MDINTIFYFPNSLTFEEYTEMLAGGDIAPRTIVFADAQKSIYKDGKKYGDISEQKFRDLLDAVENDSWISDELDGVKGDIIRNRDALNNLDNLIDQSIQGIQSDITDANQRISSLNDSISTVNSNLNTAISNRDAAIQTKVENLFDNAEWLSENFPQGQTNWDSRWDSDLESYLLTVGYWDVDDQTGEKTTKWSQLQSSVNSISSSVNDLKTNGNLTQAMTSSIESLISNDIASLSLGTTYATIASVDDVEKIVEWFYSGITSSSQADKTVAQMSAMSKNDFIAAISDIRTQVDKVANGDFVAQTEVSSKVGDTIANMLLQSSSDNALAALSAKANANSDNISALVLGMTGSTSTANLATSVSTALTNLTSGFATTSDVNGAKSEIYSAIGAKDGSGNFISLAAVKTQTDKVANGDFVAQTEVQSKVGDAVSTMLAQASTDNALAALSAKADANSDNISALILGMTGSTSTANLSTNVSNALNNLTSGFASTSDITSAKSEIYSAISAKDSNNNFISLAALKTQSDADHASVSALATNKADISGVVAKSELGTAVASLFASTGDAQNPTAKANVVAVVKDNKSALNLTAQDVNINGYLNGGSASFKGDIQASSFVTGNDNEVGIAVMAGEFNDSIANTHKVYFAYDSTQGAATMWFYQNNEWKRINLADSAVLNNAETFVATTFYSLPSENIYYLPPLSSLTTTTLYYSRVTGKYYNTQSTSDPVISGSYYQIQYNPISSDLRSAHRGPVNMLIPEVYQSHAAQSTISNTSRMTAGQYAGNVIKYTISNGEPTLSKSVWFAEVPYTYYVSDRYSIVRLAFYRNIHQQHEGQSCPTATYVHDLSGAVYTYQSSYQSGWDYSEENITLATALSDNYSGVVLQNGGWFKSNYRDEYVTQVEQDTMMYPDTAGYPNPTWS